MATTNDLKNGMVLNLDGQLWQVIWFQHHKPGKGGAVVRTKLKNVESGKTVDKTFNADVKVDVANVDKRTMQYLYNDGTSYVFMDTGTYDQLEVAPDIVGDASNFLLENQEAIVATNDGRVLYIELPASVELEITYTEPGLQGDRSTGGTKPATLETGATVQVPLFITTGEKVKVDTRDSSYLGRVSAEPTTRARPFPGPQAGPRHPLRRRAARRATPSTRWPVRWTPARGRATRTPGSSCAGVADHQARIDELLTEYSQGWALNRMPAVDRTALRIGVFELLWADDVPDAVAVDEAVCLVRELSTDDSPGFVNGVLGAMLREKDADRRLTLRGGPRSPPRG